MNIAFTVEALNRFSGPMRQMERSFRAMHDNVKVGYLNLARSSEEYAGRTNDLMSALQQLGTENRKITDNMINNSERARAGFLASIGSMLAASTQSGSIASNLERINNPIYNVNQGLLRISGGLERLARSGSPAILALQQLGPTASMAQLHSQIRLINAGIMRMGQVALVAAGASFLLYRGLHQANMEMNPKYLSSFTNMVEKLKQAFQPMVDVFAAVMTPIYNFVGAIAEMAIKFNEAHPVLAKMVQGFLMLLPALTLILSPLAVGIGLFGGLRAAIFGVWALIGPFVTGLAAVIGTAALISAAIVGLVAGFTYLYKNVDGFRNFIDGAMAAIKKSFDIAFNFIKDIVTSVMSSVSSFIGDQLKGITAWWNDNGAAIMEIVKFAFSYIKSYITLMLGNISMIFQTIFPVIVGVVKVAWAVIQAVFSTVINTILGIIGVFAKLFTGDVKGAMETAKSTVSTIWNNIVSIFKGINLAQIGKDIMQGLVNGIKSMASAVTKAVTGIASAIPAKIKSFLGIHSPSRLLFELGEFSGEGFANGIKSMISDVSGISTQMAYAAVPTFAPAQSYDSGASLARQQAATTPQKVTIEVPLYIDGNEIARATHEDISRFMGNDLGLKTRLRGMK